MIDLNGSILGGPDRATFMNTSVSRFIQRLASEAPFRIVARAALRHLNCSSELRALWDLSPRPQYLLGLVAAAAQAKNQGIGAISALEFGVAAGRGLLAMQQEAAAVEHDTGVAIKVYGFDCGPSGLPAFIGDYRDHPEEWKPGDFPMDVPALRARLTDSTALVLGNISETVPTFFQRFTPPPIGFVAIDLDLYSSTCSALQVLVSGHMLWHMPLHFDDIDSIFNHRFAGELLAIDEFNARRGDVRIDTWRGVRRGRPFPERPYLSQMYVAHDIKATSSVTLERAAGSLPLEAGGPSVRHR